MTRILVIEDNIEILEEILEWLTFEEFDAEGASDGQAGIEIALRQIPDLIISDISMPGKDGYEVLAELRSHPATALIPFIFLTAHQDRSAVRRGMDLGADDYITKPFSQPDLLGAVRSRLARHSDFKEDSDRRLQDLRRSLFHVLPHELRTPLSGILGAAEILEMNAPAFSPEEVKEYASVIASAGRRLHRLIENHLLFAQLEIRAATQPGPQYFSDSLCDLPGAIIEVTSRQLARQHERLADLHLSLHPGAVCMLGDNLKKIAYELVDNAFKFSKPETTVEVSSERQESFYVLRVADRGRGMSPEAVARIDVYAQFERAIYEQQGSGLGLILVKRLLEIHGGSLKIESVPGQATTALAYIPASDQ